VIPHATPNRLAEHGARSIAVSGFVAASTSATTTEHDQHIQERHWSGRRDSNSQPSAGKQAGCTISRISRLPLATVASSGPTWPRLAYWDVMTISNGPMITSPMIPPRSTP